MFTEALFTIAKTWKQPKCPSADEWIKKMWYIYTMEYYSAIKKNEIMPSAATWMHLEIIILSEVRKKDKYHMISLICGIKKWHKQSYLQKRNRLRHREEQTCGCQEGRQVGEGWIGSLGLAEANYYT